MYCTESDKEYQWLLSYLSSSPSRSSCLLPLPSPPPLTCHPSSPFPPPYLPSLPFSPGCSVPACPPSLEHCQRSSWPQSPFTEGHVAGSGAQCVSVERERGGEKCLWHGTIFSANSQYQTFKWLWVFFICFTYMLWFNNAVLSLIACAVWLNC